MTLAELKPRWTGLGTDITGMSFLCPHCLQTRLHVAFRGTNIKPAANQWTRTGDTWETLTLDPSADFSNSGHWHGTIIHGRLVDAQNSPRPILRD